jgi:hypothetical protein
MADVGARRGEERLGSGDPLTEVHDRRGCRGVRGREALDLFDVEHGVGLQERNTPGRLLTVVIVGAD